jgi:acetate---CoA ligase (ADP-forming) subunit beta
MLKKEILDILSTSKPLGWVLEPHAKRILSLAGMDTSRFTWTAEMEEAVKYARDLGYPVVAKVVSPKILHKSDKQGVVVGIRTDEALRQTFRRFSQMDGFVGILVDEMVSGIELIVGAKTDDQFGPVILLGIGGTGVEIYKDVTIRMAPLSLKVADSMMKCLKAHLLLEGYRGSKPVDAAKLSQLLVSFSILAVDLQEQVESIDLNPVMCSSTRCVVADARIMLKKE